ncbi:unnamed protein product [Mytilus edulis]|uniref:Ig-like domain-containing protein n=1 Tax=Mytilus edulis TaxID=6550 RepID=A0A8S3QXK6_MYTED|nr:unnamed protein product [Mytilus edulis]
MNYTSTSNSILELFDNCSYYRTSNITFLLTAEDNQAVIRCVAASSLAEENLYVQSEPLDVNYAVMMPTILIHPNKTDYLVGLDTSISLNCTAEGNPKLSYLWYKVNQIEAIGTSATLTITDVTTKHSANEGPSSTLSTNDQTLVIKESNNKNTAVIVVGTVCGSIILVLCVILFGVLQNKNKMFRCFLIRNRNDRAMEYVNTTQQQDPSLYEGVTQTFDVHNYEQLSRREHLYNNANFSNN